MQSLSNFTQSIEKEMHCICKSCGFKATIFYGTWDTPDAIVQRIKNAHQDFDSDCIEEGKEDIYVETYNNIGKETPDVNPQAIPTDTKEGAGEARASNDSGKEDK